MKVHLPLLGRSIQYAGLVVSVVLVFAAAGCRRASEPPTGPDIQAGQPMIPGSVGVIGVKAISELGNAGDFELDLFLTDSNGKPINTLDPSSINIASAIDTLFSSTGIAAAMTLANGPFSAEVLIDQSNSMAWNDPMNLRWMAAGLFLGTVTPALGGDEVQLSTFNDYTFGINTYGPFTSNGHAFDRAIDSLEQVLGPGTPLYDAMYIMADSLSQNSHNSNKALIVMTDGDDNESYHSLWESINHAKDLGIKVFAIALKTGKDTDSQIAPGSEWALFNAAMSTGGGVMKTSDPQQVVNYYAGLPKLVYGGTSYLKTTWHVKLANTASLAGRQISGTLHVASKTNGMLSAPFQVTFP
ncbi:MAG: vWA domain-containing protein [Bacteroidota bacterium]|nr:vWA domain-containing protein [Bacteroidota bacterium]MDP4233294.1 vWA domain-containing protein [Bacteroidota bacterium]MDP4242086.1 vWA domain-containing protein [Bacteroidota bacterium]MDP4288635.1 vWA domain-containing protein [Bacteroidota bacterium]